MIAKATKAIRLPATNPARSLLTSADIGPLRSFTQKRRVSAVGSSKRKAAAT
jgi:hypothetical protein